MTTYQKIYRIDYDYREDREASDFAKLNRMLSKMKLEKLELKDFDGHIGRKFAVGRPRSYYYIPDYGTLLCTLSEDGQIYQIDTMVTTSDDHEAAADRWREAHPDRAMRVRIVCQHGQLYSHIIFHHPRIQVPQEDT